MLGRDAVGEAVVQHRHDDVARLARSANVVTRWSLAFLAVVPLALLA